MSTICSIDIDTRFTNKFLRVDVTKSHEYSKINITVVETRRNGAVKLYRITHCVGRDTRYPLVPFEKYKIPQEQSKLYKNRGRRERAEER